MLYRSFKVAILGAAISSMAGSLGWGRPATADLSQDEARLRASAVRDPRYSLSLRVDAERPEFDGAAEIRFALEKPVDGLTVDFIGGKIQSLEINDTPVSTSAYNGFFIALDSGRLVSGMNKIAIHYTHPYSATGVGMYRFHDSEDGATYIYTLFEPYDANKLFPCFDQPDLKAVLSLQVEAPKDWSVVSTSSETKVAESGATRLWTFAPTPKLSTYVFSVYAGPWSVWTSSAGAGSIPLRLFARRSMAKYVHPEEWFDITRRGLDFYGKYFDYPYPFGKYDQLIVPDFNEGAMENVGAVEFSERNVHRSSATVVERQETASDILHEMGHMWFGDLVTMRWWDDLWLNESFATYMAALSMSEATPYTNEWLRFFARDKAWAYEQDVLSTTHPINGDVPDTGHAFSNFDGITYGKGASVLRQLAFLIGPDTFRDGIRAYLKQRSYGNAEQADFFAAMASASGRDLKGWIQEWLKTSGVNAVRAEYACAGGRISSFSLLQSTEAIPAPAGAPAGQPSPSDLEPLRRHKTEVRLYRALGKDGFASMGLTQVEYAGPRTPVTGLVHARCPDFVFPNQDDHDYVFVDLDPRSLAAATAKLHAFADARLRMMIWETLWEMVESARWPVDRYADLVARELGKETDTVIVESVLGDVYGGRGGSHRNTPSLLNYAPQTGPKLADAFWENLRRAKPGSDLQKIWFHAFVLTAGSGAVDRLHGLLTGKLAPKGVTLDEDTRWDLVIALNGLGAADGEALVAAETARDPSDRGAKAAISARAARPTLENKQAWFAKITDPKTALSMEELRSAMETFYFWHQPELNREFLKPVLDAVPGLIASKDDEYLEEFGYNMIPFLCREDDAAALEKFLSANPALNPGVLRHLRDAAQWYRRCIQARALAPSSR